MRQRRILIGGVALAAVALCIGAWPAADGVATLQPTLRAIASIGSVPPGDVECEVEGLHDGGLSLVEHDPQTLEPIGPIELHRHETWLVFGPRHPEGLGMLTAAGFEPIGMAWLDGSCIASYSLEKRTTARISGRVEGMDIGEAYVVSGCGQGVDVARTGQFELTVNPGPCELVVLSVVGHAMYRGPAFPLDLVAGAAVDVVLEAPQIAGEPGWELMEREYGFYVSAVRAGGAAARAGLQVGDRVLQVDGEPASELAAQDLATEMDYPVELVMDRDGDVRDVTLR